jgi:RHS repeat-associated protein
VDKTGNRRSITEATGRKAAFDYDALYRLTKETITGDPAGNNRAISYVLDAVGNRLSRSSTVSGIANQAFTYDTNDRLTSDTWDANGNTIASGTGILPVSYAYDFEDKLTTYTTNSSVGAVFTYDGDGNRTVKVVPGQPTVRYLVDDNNPTGYAQVVEERTGSGAAQSIVRSYSYGNDLLSQRTASGGAVNFYGYDALGSTRLLANASGAVTDTYTYEAFGNELNRTGTTVNAYRYSGEQTDDELASVYLRSRLMSLNSYRFMTADQFEGNRHSPITLNHYIYANGNPSNYTDPAGTIASFTELLISLYIESLQQTKAAYNAKKRIIEYEM